MADSVPRRHLGRLTARAPRWDPERVATYLVPQRDRLVDQLPRELASARGLTRDQAELVIDEAIDFMVTEYAKPILDEAALVRAFWATASFRVKRVHEGRAATVRAGWRRVDVQDVEIAAEDPDPSARALRRMEHGALLDFAATLSDLERRVLACKFADGPKEIGRVLVARRLGLPVTDVRRAERAIARKLERFIAIVSAGSLCAHRGTAIEALATGLADDKQALAARAHLAHCSACRVTYLEHLRAVRAGELQHRIAQLLPLPGTTAEQKRANGAWEAVADWMSRPFASEAATNSAYVAAGGRGIGAIATAKLAALCVGGATVLGGGTYCVTTVLQPEPPRERHLPARVAKRPGPPPADATQPSPARALVRIRKADERRAARRRAERRRERREAAPTTRTAFGSGGNPASRHEREAPISPPVEVSGAPVQEFEPGPTGPVTTAPATTPSTGAPEFP